MNERRRFLSASLFATASVCGCATMLANIRPSVLKVKGIDGPQDSKNKKLVQAAADQNVMDAAAMLMTQSHVLAGLVSERKLRIVPAMHDISTGRIHWLA